MPVPSGFEIRLRIVATPSAANLNAELNTQLAAGFILNDLRLTPDLSTGIMQFTKTNADVYAYPVPQKINAVNIDQTDINDDIAAEALDHNWPTGIVVYDDTTVYIIYTGLTSGGGE